ncbi:isochorismatase family protein [Aestuariivirga sp.]|uniref:isochorismatase family protein n=1 Tax=Aestuariivirga sp. TaxID=2650926 RepID=UPI0035947DD6
MQHRLIDRHTTCLIVIDVQQYFLDKLSVHWRVPLVQRIAWLMRVARALDIPIIATAEDMANDGPLVPEVSAELPPGCIVHDKMVFGLAGQRSILDDVTRSGRRDLVLVGLETDVCIAHSAIGLMEQDYRVTVIEDATASPPPHHEAGLRRIAAAGGIVTNTKGIHYEWVRDLATLSALKQKIGTSLPPGLTL